MLSSNQMTMLYFKSEVEVENITTYQCNFKKIDKILAYRFYFQKQKSNLAISIHLVENYVKCKC